MSAATAQAASMALVDPDPKVLGAALTGVGTGLVDAAAEELPGVVFEADGAELELVAEADALDATLEVGAGAAAEKLVSQKRDWIMGGDTLPGGMTEKVLLVA